MIRIHHLDPATAAGIAAGEVIERPACVVKELIDNSLDAGSTRIDIDLENGGRRLIQVSDNGSGMYRDEVLLALQRYTTSKIRRLDDLQKLTTLGFRGEALASIATVAEVEIYTRPNDCPEGVVGIAGAGRHASVQSMGSPIGTRVCVHHLFHHLPVRLRTLKAVSGELRLIQEMVSHYALARPTVTFHLRHDGRRLLFSQGRSGVQQGLPWVLGGDLASQMYPIEYANVDIHVIGFIAPPDLHRASRQRQYLWINGRPVRYALLNHAVERIFAGAVPPGRHPIFAIGLTVPPNMLDVNIHPRKVEVKLLHERAVFAALQEAVAIALQNMPDGLGDGAGPNEPGTWDAFTGQSGVIAETAHDYPPLQRNMMPGDMEPLGQVGNTYVVAKGVEGLWLLDQHAAHESLIYEQLMQAAGACSSLNEPLHVNLHSELAQWLRQGMPLLRRLKFDIDIIGRHVVVNAVPEVLHGSIQIGNVIEAIQEAQHRLKKSCSPEAFEEQLCAAFACRNALRAGDVLEYNQLTELVDAANRQKMSAACPHGRPTYVSLTMSELERRFLRFFPLDT